jgi:hypothetical protein
MFVVDTNILLLAANRDVTGHSECAELLESWRHRTSPWYLTWGIAYEFLRVATHPKVLGTPFRMQQALSFVSSLLASPALGILTETPGHMEAVSTVLKAVPAASGNIVFDAHTAALMREHGVRTIYTRDRGFLRFPNLEVIDPL